MAVGDKVYAEHGRRVEGSVHPSGNAVTVIVTGELDMHVLTVGRGPDGITDLGTTCMSRFVQLPSSSEAQVKRAMAVAIREMHQDLDSKRDTFARPEADLVN